MVSLLKTLTIKDSHATVKSL